MTVTEPNSIPEMEVKEVFSDYNEEAVEHIRGGDVTGPSNISIAISFLQVIDDDLDFPVSSAEHSQWQL